MRIVINAKQFLACFKEVSSFASKREIKPITTNVRCIADESGVILEATNCETSIRFWFSEGIDVTEPGESLLPPKILLKILSEIPKNAQDSVVIESVGTGLRIIGDKFKYNIPTTVDYEFPTIPPFDSESYHTLDLPSFLELLGRTRVSCDPQNSHYSLGGIMMNFNQDSVEAVSTDGRRLSYLKRTSFENVGNFVSVGSTNVPAEAAGSFCRFVSYLSKSSDVETLDVYSDRGQIFIRCGSALLTSTLLDGRYPNWEKIIPNENDCTKVMISLATLENGVRQASIIEDEKRPGTWLRFEKNKLTFSSTGESKGDSNVEVDINYEDEPRQIKFDSRFLLDFVNSVDLDQEAEFFIKENKPNLFVLSDGGKYVVMPLS